MKREHKKEQKDSEIELKGSVLPLDKVVDYLDPEEPAKLEQAELAIAQANSLSMHYFSTWLKKCCEMELEQTAEKIIKKLEAYPDYKTAVIKSLLLIVVQDSNDKYKKFLGRKLSKLTEEAYEYDKKLHFVKIVWEAVNSGQISSIELLLDLGLPIKETFYINPDYAWINILHCAVLHRKTETVRFLIEYSLSTKNKDALNSRTMPYNFGGTEKTGIELAIDLGNPEIAILFLRAGAKLPNEEYGVKLLKIIAKDEYLEDFKKVMAHYKWKKNNPFLSDILLETIKNGSLAIFTYLILLDIPITASHSEVLVWAAQGGSVPLIALLQTRTDNIQNVKFEESSPITSAVRFGRVEMLEYLGSLAKSEDDFKADLTKEMKFAPKELIQYGYVFLSTLATHFGHLSVLEYLKSKNALKLEDNLFQIAMNNSHHQVAIWLLKQGVKFTTSGKGLYKKSDHEDRAFVLLLELENTIIVNDGLCQFLKEIEKEPVLQDKQFQELLRERFLQSISEEKKCTPQLLALLIFDPISGLDFALEKGLPIEQLDISKIRSALPDSDLMQYTVFHQVRHLILANVPFNSDFIKLVLLNFENKKFTLPLNLYHYLEKKILDFSATRYSNYLRAIIALEILNELPACKNSNVQEKIDELKNKINSFLQSGKLANNSRLCHRSAAKLFMLHQSFKTASDENSVNIYFQVIDLDFSEDKISRITNKNYLAELHTCVSKVQHLEAPHPSSSNPPTNKGGL